MLKALVLAALMTGGASAAELWFAPNDNLPRGAQRDIVLNQDFPKLFEGDDAWTDRLDVFAISPMMAAIGPEADLRRIDAFLRKRKVALAAGADIELSDGPQGACGRGVEGMRPPEQNKVAFARLKRFGLDVRYIAADEPLTYGHYHHGPNGCRYSIEETARRAAAGVAEIRAAYPDVRIEDAEAPWLQEPVAQWRADFGTWLDAYAKAAGKPIDSVAFDVDLFGDWRAHVAAGVEAAHRRGVRAGIFLIKPGRGGTNAEAVANYLRAAAAIDASGIAFDFVEVANWTPHPFANLPPSDPTTLTYVLEAWKRKHPAR
jgi:hypothetical protein